MELHLEAMGKRLALAKKKQLWEDGAPFRSAQKANPASGCYRVEAVESGRLGVEIEELLEEWDSNVG